MTSAEILVAIIAFILAGISAFISVRQFKEKGFLFNNANIWESENEREELDKSPHYRQSGVVFALISAVFLVIVISILAQNYKIRLLEIPLIIGALIYAFISYAKIERRKKK